MKRYVVTVIVDVDDSVDGECLREELNRVAKPSKWAYWHALDAAIQRVPEPVPEDAE